MRKNLFSLLALACLSALVTVASAPRLSAADDPETAKFEAAMQKGIAYLKAQQNPDGSWGKDWKTGQPHGNIGITALIVDSLVIGPFGEDMKKSDTISKAVDFLLKSQNAAGAFAAPGEGDENYYTCNVVIALCAIDKDKYKDQVTKAVKFLEGCQCVEAQGYDPKRHPLAFGGQGYGSAAKPDMGNTGFFIEALIAAGHPVDSKEFKDAMVFLHHCQASAEVNDLPWAKNIDPTRTDKGGGIYAPNDSAAGEVTDPRTGNKSWRAYGSMTYDLVKSYVYLDVKPDSPELKAAFQFIANNYSVDHNPGMGQTGFYYYCLLMSKALNAYDQEVGSRYVKDADGTEHDWSKELGEKLVSLQTDGGFWQNTKDRWWETDPKLCTAYALVTFDQILELRAKVADKK
ncbi:MAG: prenyltransferase/squalene oxidase repeat-containing protein [Planctomycetota bacterium]